MINVIVDTGIETNKLEAIDLDVALCLNEELGKTVVINSLGIPTLVEEDHVVVGEEATTVKINKQSLHGFSVLSNEEHGLTLTSLYCGEYTFYHASLAFGKGKINFYVPRVSVNVEEAVANLFAMNIERGSEAYAKTNGWIPNFFKEAFKAVLNQQEKYVVDMVVRSRCKKHEVTVNLYWDNLDSSNNSISFGGAVYGLDFDVFPRGAMGAAVRNQQRIEAKREADSKPASNSLANSAVFKDGSMAQLLDQLNIRKERPALFDKQR